MVLSDVDVAEPVAHLADGARHVGLFDVHVVGVQVDHDVVGADVVGQLHRLARGVDKVGLIAVADLKAERDVIVRGSRGEFADDADRVGPARRRWCGRVFAQRAEQCSGEDPAAQADGGFQAGTQQRRTPLDDRRIVAGHVGVEGQPTGTHDAEPRLRKQGPRSRHIQPFQVMQRQLKQVEAGFARAADRVPDRVGGGVADPHEGVNAQGVRPEGLIHELFLACCS